MSGADIGPKLVQPDVSGAPDAKPFVSERIQISDDGSYCAIDGQRVNIRGKALKLLDLIVSHADGASYEEIYRHAWDTGLPVVENKKRKEINKIHQLARTLRRHVGKGALVALNGGYAFKPNAISVGRGQPPQSNAVQSALTSLSVGAVISTGDIQNILYDRRVESERTILSGRDPLASLFGNVDKFFGAISERVYWVIAIDADQVAVRLADLADHAHKRGVLRNALRTIRDHLRIVLVNHESEVASIVLESCHLRFILAADGQTAFLQDKGHALLHSTRQMLGRYGVGSRGPIVQKMAGGDESPAVPAGFVVSFRSICGNLPDLAVDQITAAWFGDPEPRSEEDRQGTTRSSR